MSELAKSKIKFLIHQTELVSDCLTADKIKLLSTIIHKIKHLFSFDKTDVDMYTALELFDDTISNDEYFFSQICQNDEINMNKLSATDLPTEPNVIRQLKIDVSYCCVQIFKLIESQQKIDILSLHAIFRELIEHGLKQEHIRKTRTILIKNMKQRRTTLHNLKNQEELMKLARPKQVLPKKVESKRGSLVRRTAYMSSYGVPLWPIQHLKLVSHTRIENEVNAIKELNNMCTINEYISNIENRKADLFTKMSYAEAADAYNMMCAKTENNTENENHNENEITATDMSSMANTFLLSKLGNEFSESTDIIKAVKNCKILEDKLRSLQSGMKLQQRYRKLHTMLKYKLGKLDNATLEKKYGSEWVRTELVQIKSEKRNSEQLKTKFDQIDHYWKSPELKKMLNEVLYDNDDNKHKPIFSRNPYFNHLANGIKNEYESLTKNEKKLKQQFGNSMSQGTQLKTMLEQGADTAFITLEQIDKDIAILEKQILDLIENINNCHKIGDILKNSTEFECKMITQMKVLIPVKNSK